MYIEFSFGLVSVIVGIIVSISRVTYVTGYNRGIKEHNAPKLSQLDQTGSVVQVIAVILVVLGAFTIPRATTTNTISTYQGTVILDLAGELFRRQIVDKIEEALIKMEEDKIDPNDAFFRNGLKKEIEDTSTLNRATIRRGDFILSNGKPFIDALNEIFPPNQIGEEFDLISIDFANPKHSYDKKLDIISKTIQVSQAEVIARFQESN